MQIHAISHKHVLCEAMHITITDQVPTSEVAFTRPRTSEFLGYLLSTARDLPCTHYDVPSEARRQELLHMAFKKTTD